MRQGRTFFIVCSPPEWMDIADLYAFLKGAGLNSGKCVKETGKEGAHPHLNWIMTSPPDYQEVMTKLEDYVTSHRYPCGKRRRMTASLRKHLLVYKEVYDTDRLEGYITKEAQHEVLHDLPYEEHHWEFEWIKRNKFDEEILVNACNWFRNHSVEKQYLLLSSQDRAEAEISRMVYHYGGVELHFKFLKLRRDTREAMIESIKIQSGLKIRNTISNAELPPSLLEDLQA